MLNLLRRDSKKLFVFGSLLLLSAIVMASYAMDFSRKTLIDLKLDEKIAYLDAIYETMDSSESGGYTTAEERAKVVKPVIQALDKAFGVYACIYDSKLQPKMQTAKSRDGLTLDPFSYEGIADAVMSGSEGRLDIQHPIPKLGDKYKVALYYKWHPSDIDAEGRVCVILGVTSQAIPTTFESYITAIFSFLVIVGMTGMIVFFVRDIMDGVEPGDEYDRRG